MKRTTSVPPIMPTSQDTPMPWYVCRTKPRQEHLARSRLEEQGYEVFVPLLPEWKKKNETWRKHDHPMFPRYCFVRCGRSGQSLNPIRSTPGVSGLVSFANAPAILKDAELEAIRMLCANRQVQDNALTPFRAGNAVEISSGPLKGLNGIVSKSAEDRVTVLLSLLGSEKQVALPADQLALA